jgi:hypothetical protein
MKRSRILLLVAVSVTAALYFGISATAKAGYGSPTAYQVEISANPSGEGLWFWASLDQGGGFGHVMGPIEVDFAGVGFPIITGTMDRAQIQIAP